MNALLRAAGVDKEVHGSATDVFTFVSGSTIPVKPFGAVHSALVGNASKIALSSFCVNPPGQWAPCKEKTGTSKATMAVKHHQWVVLTRKHAARCLEKETRIGNYSSARIDINMPLGSVPGP